MLFLFLTVHDVDIKLRFICEPNKGLCESTLENFLPPGIGWDKCGKRLLELLNEFLADSPDALRKCGNNKDEIGLLPIRQKLINGMFGSAVEVGQSVLDFLALVKSEREDDDRLKGLIERIAAKTEAVVNGFKHGDDDDDDGDDESGNNKDLKRVRRKRRTNSPQPGTSSSSSSAITVSPCKRPNTKLTKGTSRPRGTASKVDPKKNPSFVALFDSLKDIFGDRESEDELEKIALEFHEADNLSIEAAFDRLWTKYGNKREMNGQQQQQQQQQQQHEGFRLYHYVPSRYYDHCDAVAGHVRTAEGVFLRMIGKLKHLREIDGILDPNSSVSGIDFVRNPLLEEKFERRKAEFVAGGKDGREVLLFYDSGVKNMERVLKSGFGSSAASNVEDEDDDDEKMFSEFPRISLGFGSGLLLCRVLLGQVNSTAAHA